MKNRRVMWMFAAVALLLVASAWLSPITSATAQTAPVTTELQVPVDKIVFNRVTGEFVRLSGQIKLRADVTLDASGGAQVRFKAEAQGEGTGQTSGARYRLIGADTFDSNVRGPLPSDLLFPARAYIIGPRTEDNLRVQVHIQVTVARDARVSAIARDVMVPQ